MPRKPPSSRHVRTQQTRISGSTRLQGEPENNPASMTAHATWPTPVTGAILGRVMRLESAAANGTCFMLELAGREQQYLVTAAHVLPPAQQDPAHLQLHRARSSGTCRAPRLTRRAAGRPDRRSPPATAPRRPAASAARALAGRSRPGGRAASRRRTVHAESAGTNVRRPRRYA